MVKNRPWLGRLLGTIFGYLLHNGPGALVGFFLGYLFDNAMAQVASHRVLGAQQHFVTSLFAVMGHIAKADGRVSEADIGLARAMMQQMQLNPAQMRLAMESYNLGKSPHFNLEAALNPVRLSCSRVPMLRRMFLELQISAAFAEGSIHTNVVPVLEKVALLLGASKTEFQQLLNAFKMRAYVFQGQHFGERSGSIHRPQTSMLERAYAILGVARSASFAEVKTAYRKLMSQHHPDKLMAKGLPENMLKAATAKAQEIKEAYEVIAKHLGER